PYILLERKVQPLSFYDDITSLFRAFFFVHNHLMYWNQRRKGISSADRNMNENIHIPRLRMLLYKLYYIHDSKDLILSRDEIERLWNRNKDTNFENYILALR